MLLALEANIEYLRQEGDSQIRIRNGKLIDSSGDIFIYEFDLDFLQNIEPDADVEVRLGAEWSTGRVIAINDKKIQIELEKSLGQTIPEAKLVISSYYLLQLLHDKLQEVNNGVISLSGIEQKVFGIKKVHSNLLDYTIPFSKGFPPNSSQKEAIRLSLGSDVSFIWGPPGTGKTQTIARIIEGFLSAGKSILLISHTNIATDGALYATVKHLSSTEDYNDGKFVREGNIYNKELKEKYPLVIAEKIIEKRAEPLKNAIEEVLIKIEKINQQLVGINNQLEQIRHLSDLEEKIVNLSGYIHTQSVKINSKNSEIELLNYKLAEVNSKIEKYNASGKISKLFSGSKIEKLNEQKLNILSRLEKSKQFILALDDEIRELANKLSSLEENKTNAQRATIGIDGAALNAQKEEVNAQLNELNNEKLALQKQLDELTTNIILEAKVVATTLTKSYSSKVILSREYDCVILDEASMAPMPAIWFAAGLAKQNVVIVGDFLQLPPIAKYQALRSKDKSQEEYQKEEQLINKWLKRDIFKTAGISGAIDKGEEPDQLRQLKVQYRMHPDIGDVINFLVYERKNEKFALKHGNETKNNGIKLLKSDPLKNAHVGIYDTSAYGPFPTRTDSGSYYNLYQALLAVELAQIAVKSGYKEIGIISPFRGQANLIQKIVQDVELEKNIEADTVHRFQGGEKQIVIFDITTPMPTMLTDDREVGGDDEKLINVAFSRAQEKFIVIGDITRILKKHSPSSLIRRFLEYSRDKQFPVISTDDILPRFSATQAAEKWMKKINKIGQLEKDLKNSALFDQSDFYQQFLKDLFKAKKEVIIDSPFVTKKRSEFFLPIFDTLIKKGVNIFIITRQVKEHDEILKYQATEALKKFEEMGIIVLPFMGKIHRKLAIVDRKILWEGSLNILSQRDSEEIMRRFEGRDTAKQMMMYLKLDKNIGGIGENNLKECPHCAGPGAWFWTDKGRFGMWTFCLVGGHAENKPPKTEAERKASKAKLRELRNSEKEISNAGVPICPKHNLEMVLRKGPFGEFWGCPKYPRCRITHKMGKKA